MKALSMISATLALSLTCAALTHAPAMALEGSELKYATPYIVGECVTHSSHEYTCPVETQGRKLTREDVFSMLPDFGAAVEVVMRWNGATIHEGYGRNRITTHLIMQHTR